MSHTFRRLPAAYKDHCDRQTRVDYDTSAVFVDEPCDLTSCYDYYPEKTCRLSISGNSERLSSIHLSDQKVKVSKKTKVVLRRKDAVRNRSDPFIQYNLPEFVINMIFSNLRQGDLCSVQLVCKKFYDIAKTSSNFGTIDASERPVSEISLAGIMNTKVHALRLAGARSDPVLSLPLNALKTSFYVASRLEFLDLSRANLTCRQLLILLKPCRRLLCLSLEGNKLDDTIASCIASNEGLVQLDISMTQGITREGAFHIFRRCRKLDQLNIAWCGMDTEILNVLFANITSRIRRLNISGTERGYGLNDDHVQILTRACPHLSELDLSDNVDIGVASIFFIVEYLLKLQVISLNRCYGINPNYLQRLNKLVSLRYLNAHGCISSHSLRDFADLCEGIKINQQYFNFIAKPATSTAPSNLIWGVSVKEKIY